MLDVHQRFIRFLETRRNLDRELEALPDDEEIGERKREHGGLTRPELAVLLAYSKIDLYAELLESDVPEDPVPVRRARALLPGAAAGALRRGRCARTGCAARS